MYSLGLLHAVLTVVRRRESLFRYALAALRVGAVFHLVSLAEETMIQRHFPATNLYESLSLCAFLIVCAYLLAHWHYKLETLSIAIFPIVFMMTMGAALGSPVTAWSNPVVRSVWLTVHATMALLGYAALVLMAMGAVIYLFQERELKRKKPRAFYYRLPPLGTLDELISRSMGLGFMFITVALVVGSIWAFVEVGTRWIVEPRIVVALFTWLLYLAMVVLRVTAGWRGRKAAILALSALGCSAATWVSHAGLFAKLTQ